MIWQFPKTLFINVKRFIYYPIPRKIKDRIFLEEEVMDLTAFSQDVIENLEGQRSGNYKLAGFIDHYGEIGYGHYTAYTAETNGEDTTWWNIDDTKTKKIGSTNKLSLFNQGSPDVYIMALELVD